MTLKDFLFSSLCDCVVLIEDTYTTDEIEDFKVGALDKNKGKCEEYANYEVLDFCIHDLDTILVTVILPSEKWRERTEEKINAITTDTQFKEILEWIEELDLSDEDYGWARKTALERQTIVHKDNAREPALSETETIMETLNRR